MTRSTWKPRSNQPSPEPRREVDAADAPVPVWLFALLGVLIVWGAYHLAEEGGRFHPSVYRPYRSIEQLRAMIPSSKEDIRVTTGRRLYGIYCSVCHQPAGEGVPGQFPPLAQSEWVISPGYNRLVRMVLHGIDGPMTVRGQDYNNTMPPFQNLLSDEQIAAILTFIRQNPAWGNHASIVSPDRVRVIRQRTTGRGIPWTASELLEINDELVGD